MGSGWIGVDLDGTLAQYKTGEFSPTKIGAPVEAMVNRVRRWLDDGEDVRIFTARVSSDGTPERDAEAAAARVAIVEWCKEHLGYEIPVTNCKDYMMTELYDDRAVQVEQNTGRLIGYSTR